MTYLMGDSTEIQNEFYSRVINMLDNKYDKLLCDSHYIYCFIFSDDSTEMHEKKDKLFIRRRK